ncbi:MAG: hypothetical protein OSB62_05515 [Alphaproteobacteria bacterium]|nr:hypothetical protein [Alphaproteobacteria bacterium]
MVVQAFPKFTPLRTDDDDPMQILPDGCLMPDEPLARTTCKVIVMVDDNEKIRRFTYIVESTDAGPSGQAKTATQNALALKAKILQDGIDEVIEEEVDGETLRTLNCYLPHTFTSITITYVDETVQSTDATREDLRTSY